MKQITLSERIIIEAGLCSGKSMRKISEDIGKCPDAGAEIVTIAAQAISAFEGMKIMRADKGDSGWRLKYISLSDAYPIGRIAESISEAVGETVVMIRLDYDFELAARLMFSN